jgi:hypothetical protein
MVLVSMENYLIFLFRPNDADDKVDKSDIEITKMGVE